MKEVLVVELVEEVEELLEELVEEVEELVEEVEELVEEENVVLTGTVNVPTVFACVTVTNRTIQIAASPVASECSLTCCLRFLGLLLQDRWHLCQRSLSVHQFRVVSKL